MSNVNPGGRLGVLHALRGLAALLVLYAHLFAVGASDPVTPHAYIPAIFGTPIADSEGGGVGFYLMPELWLGSMGVNSGHLGVMIFFLISGFVIVLSCRRTDPITFLVRRALRIYPTCFVAVALTVAGGAAYCAAYDVDYPFGVAVAIHSALLTSGWVGSAAVIPVLWTLAAEVSFYLILSVVSAVAGGAIGFRALVGAGLLCLVVIAIGALADQAGTAEPVLGAILRWSAFLAVYVNFMLLGGALSLAMFREGRRAVAFAGIAGAIGVYSLGVLLHQRFVGGDSSIVVDLEIAVLFAGVIYLSKWIRSTAILDFFGDISYPLYLIHVPLSWVVLNEVTRRGGGIHLAVIAAVTAVVSGAWLLHRWIECPSQKWSQRFDAGTWRWLREGRGWRWSATAVREGTGTR